MVDSAVSSATYTVTVATPVSALTIWYTTDGTEPSDTNGTEYVEGDRGRNPDTDRRLHPSGLVRNLIGHAPSK